MNPQIFANIVRGNIIDKERDDFGKEVEKLIAKGYPRKLAVKEVKKRLNRAIRGKMA